jgi:hypothetical protein
MTFSFIPAGLPVSNSHAISAKFAVTTSLGGYPTTASLAEYVVNYTGPTGPDGVTVSAIFP